MLDEATSVDRAVSATEQERLLAFYVERTARLERRLERVRTLQRLTRLVSTSLDLDHVLREIARAAVELTGAVFASFWLADDEARVIRLGAYSDDAFAADSSLRQMAYGEGTSGRVAQSRRPLLIDDVFEEGGSMILDWWQRHGLTSILAVPVLHADHLLAVLALNGRAPFRLDALDDEMLETFLAQAGAAIHNASLYEDVRRSREQLQAIVDYSPTAISLKDQYGRYLLTNRRWKSARGFDPDAPPERDVTRGRTDHELFPEKMADVLRARDLQVEETRQAFEYEVPVVVDGEDRVFLSVKFPLFDALDAVYANGTISTDITERKRWEEGIAASLEAQRAANEQLERLNRATSEFVGIVSHEFRTPLTSIQGLSELLRDEDFGPEQVKLFAGDIHQEVGRLTRMINEMLDLDRMEAGQMRLRLETVNLGSIVRAVVERARPTAPRHSLCCQVDPALPTLTGDRDRLTQVAVNLLSNAIKYSPDGGDVVVGVSLNRELERSEAHFWVRDRGVGIPPDKLDTVFERYTRIESDALRKIKGTGLGLPIVRQIVELHGGQVWVESEVGHGSTFHVFLPVIPGEPSGGGADRIEGGADDRG